MMLGTVIALAAGCADPRSVEVKTAPIQLTPPHDQALVISAHGIGVQIYACRTGNTDPASFAWTLIAPEAALRYESGKELGKHFAGPTWQAIDGSKVVGELVARADAPDEGAIPWLLLRAQTTSGNGVFSTIRSIQRLHTMGGKAPATGCADAYSGAEVRVPYSADYYFYAARR